MTGLEQRLKRLERKYPNKKIRMLVGRLFPDGNGFMLIYNAGTIGDSKEYRERFETESDAMKRCEELYNEYPKPENFCLIAHYC